MCYTNGLYNACANRAYYAMFQAAVGMLMTKGFVFEQKQHFDHAKVLAMFANEFINRKKVFQSKFKSHLYDAQIIRGMADYEIRMISRKRAHRQLTKVKELTDAINQELQNA